MQMTFWNVFSWWVIFGILPYLDSNFTWKFIPKGPFNDKPVLVQEMAWCCTGDQQAAVTWTIDNLVQLCIYLHHQASVSWTHCGPVMPYGDTDLGRQSLRYWLVAWRHQAITWNSVDLSSNVICGIQLRAISQNCWWILSTTYWWLNVKLQ